MTMKKKKKFMNNYSNLSRTRLDECHSDLRTIFETVLPMFDHAIMCGFRNEKDQNKAFKEGHTKLPFPQSKHNLQPAMAVDAAPYPIDYQDVKRFYHFAGYVRATAQILFNTKQISHLVRWGGDWDKDTDIKDNVFNDLPHYELYKPE